MNARRSLAIIAVLVATNAASAALAQDRPDWLERLRVRAGEVDPLSPSCWQDQLGAVRIPCPDDAAADMEVELFLLEGDAFSARGLTVALVEGAAIALRMPFVPAKVWCTAPDPVGVHFEESSPWITLTGLSSGRATCFAEQERGPFPASRLPLQQQISVMVRPFAGTPAMSTLPVSEVIVRMDLRLGEAVEMSLPFEPSSGFSSSSKVLRGVFEAGTRQLYLDPQSPGTARYTVVAAGERRRVEYLVRVRDAHE